MNPWSTPQWVGQAHPSDQGSGLRVYSRPSTAAVSALPSPEHPESLPVPADDGLGLDDHERPLPTAPPPPEDGPEGPIEVGQGRPALGLEDRELLPESEILEGELPATLQSCSRRPKQNSKKAKHHVARILLAFAQSPTAARMEFLVGTRMLGFEGQ